MAYIFKPAWKRKGKRKSKKLGRWYIRVRGADGRLRTVKGFHDKAATQAKAVELERRFERQRAGLIDPHDEQARRPIGEHLADFERNLTERERTPRHVRLVVSRVRRVLDGCHISIASDLLPSKVQGFLGEQRSDGMSAQTATHYVRNVREFVRWLVKDGRIASDPLVSLEGFRVETDRRVVRRALDPDEAANLLDAAASSPVTFMGLTGKAREALYLTAMRTGLRAAELASLTPRSLDLDAVPPMLAIEAGDSKNRKASTLPLHADAVELLRPLASRAPAEAPLWPGNWWKYAARMLRVDLAEADIPFEVGGQVLDFHALRHSAGTFATLSGMHPRLAQQLMRHSDINLTMARYTHIAGADLAAAVDRMPRLRPSPASSTEAKSATGT